MVLKLTREKGELLKQITQADDANQTMAAENSRLLERIRSLCAEMERWKVSSSELEDTRASLAASDAACQRSERAVQRTNAAKAVIEEELKKHILEVNQLKNELSLSEQRESKHRREALRNRECMMRLEQENTKLQELLSDESSKLESTALTVVEISKSIKSLKQEKAELERKLCKLQSENSRLRDNLLSLEASLTTSMTSATLTGSSSSSPSDPLLGSACGCNGEGAFESDEGVFDERCASPGGLSSLPICQEAMLGSKRCQDSTNSSTLLMQRGAVLRTPFRGILRAQSWDMVSALDEELEAEVELSNARIQELESQVPLKKTTFMLERPETESAQGSLEGQEAFPSFSDVVLVAQGLSKDSPDLRDNLLSLEASLTTSMTSATLTGSSSSSPSDPLLGSACGCNGEGAFESDEGVFDERCASPGGLSSLPICQEAMLGSKRCQDSTNSSTLLMQRGAVLRTPFRGILRAQSWDMVSALDEEDVTDGILPCPTAHSSLPSRIVAVPKNMVDTKGADFRRRLQELEAEVELSNARIQELESQLREKEELQNGLERHLRFLSGMLCLLLVGLCEARQVLKRLNDAAVRILESHTGPASISAQVQQDNRLVSALEDVSPDSVYSFPEDVVREQIELELQTLRSQITKSQAVLTYLHARSSRLPLRPALSSSAADRRAAFYRRGFSEDGPHPDDQVYDTVGTAKPRCSTAHRGNLSSEHRPPSHDNRPRLSSTFSCPVLPGRDATVARATQTERTPVLSRESQTDRSEARSEPRSVPPLIPNGPVPLVQSKAPAAVASSATSPLLRRRTHSFVCAIREGNSQLVDAATEDEATTDSTPQAPPPS
ncbi:uncharacterized protein ISCGN_020836 [Ixodes scapularis]